MEQIRAEHFAEVPVTLSNRTSEQRRLRFLPALCVLSLFGVPLRTFFGRRPEGLQAGKQVMTSQKANVLVFGGSGMLGSMVVDVLSRDPAAAVSATVRSEALRTRWPGSIPAWTGRVRSVP